MFFKSRFPAFSNETFIFLFIISKTVFDIQIPDGFATASSLAAIFTASPNKLSSEIITSPIFIPMRNTIWSSFGLLSFNVLILS